MSCNNAPIHWKQLNSFYDCVGFSDALFCFDDLLPMDAIDWPLVNVLAVWVMHVSGVSNSRSSLNVFLTITRKIGTAGTAVCESRGATPSDTSVHMNWSVAWSGLIRPSMLPQPLAIQRLPCIGHVALFCKHNPLHNPSASQAWLLALRVRTPSFCDGVSCDLCGFVWIALILHDT